MRTARRIAWLAGIPLAVLAAVGSAALIAGTASRPLPVRSAGVVRWSDATAPSRDGRTLTVTADLAGVRPHGCERMIGRPAVDESPTTVRIRVHVLASPAPQGRVCSAFLPSRLPVTVRLRAAIGSRVLVDGTAGATRPLRFAAGGTG